MKYYVRKTDMKTGEVMYKKCMTLDGFVRDKSLCWQYTKQGALMIVERYKQQNRYMPNRSVYKNRFVYDIEEVQE